MFIKSILVFYSSSMSNFKKLCAHKCVPEDVPCVEGFPLVLFAQHSSEGWDELDGMRGGMS